MNSIKKSIRKKLVSRFSKIDRESISCLFIKGNGIEIGGLNYPLPVNPGVEVKYLDRISAEDHYAVLKELKGQSLVKVDIIDNGETMSTVPDASQDFVIANHFIEHCQNPIMTIGNMLRVLKNGGIVFMAIPDKRFTFDSKRATTPLEHFVRDYQEGPEWSEAEHYEDFVRNTEWSDNAKSDDDIFGVIEHLKSINFSIHFHVWSHPTMIDFFQMLRNKLGFPFEIELSLAPNRGGNESIFILRKV